MDVRWISATGVESHTRAELPALLEREDGFLWLDIPSCDEEAAQVLANVFRFHPHAVRDCLERRRIPKIHTYADHVFLVLHSIEFEEERRGHLLELDQFVGDQYLITVHGPMNPDVPPEAALRETNSTLRRIEAGRFLPETPAELAHGIISVLILRLEAFVSEIAEKVAAVERSIVATEKRNPEEVVERLFRLRHQLLTIRTTAGLSREVFAGRLTVARSSASPRRVGLIEDIIDQYERLKFLCDGEKDFLDQVLDFHQARTVTKMNIAMERLALIAAVLLPVTAISGVYGMNIIVNAATDRLHVAGIVFFMAIIVGLMLWWAKRNDWW
jgi:magnesium transporter